MPIYGRTDLASEAHRLWQDQAKTTSRLRGVRAVEESVLGFSVSAVEIMDEEGEAALHKPRGQYYSLCLPNPIIHGGEDYERAVEALAVLIRRCLPPKGEHPVLIAALGNPDVTPDALGPLCAQSILVTQHLQQDSMFSSFCPTVLLRTGVLGTTGLESAFQVKTLCQALHPDCVLVIDALAGVDSEDLCRCIQICDSGIAPGSGVGNDREALNREALGVPVVAIGVPTVIDAASLAPESGLSSLFVTPRYIDSAVRQLGRLIGYGINRALHDGLSISDMDMLLS